MSDKLQGGIKAGSTDVSLPVEIRSSSDSTALTGLSNTDITAYYWRQGGTATSVTDSALGSVNAAHTDGGFIEVDATNMPGIYRFDIPDAAVATGADWVVITLEATGGFAESFMLNLTTNVVQTGDAFGRLGSPAGASVSADIATVDTVADAVKAVTDNLPDSGALSSLPSADKLLAYVQLLARSDAAIATDRSAELAEINANEGTGAGDYDQETDSQEAIDTTLASGTSGLDALKALIDAIQADLDNGTDGLGALLSAINVNGGALGTLQTQVGDVLTDTGTTLPATLTTIEGKVDTVDTVADGIQADLSNATDGLGALKTVVDAILTHTGTTLPSQISSVQGDVATVDTVVDAIKAVTDNLPDSGALSDLAEILTDTGTTIPALLAALNDPTVAAIADAVWTEALADHSGTAGSTAEGLDNAGGGLTVAAIADGVWDEAQSGHTTAGTFGRFLDAQVSAINTGTGAYSVTVTVTDGTSALENATVRVTEGVNSFVGATDASGNVTFSLDAATYTVSLTKGGYSYTPETRTVTGAEAGTLTNDLEMTVVVAPAAGDPAECTVYIDTQEIDGTLTADVDVTLQLVGTSTKTSGGAVLSLEKSTMTTNAAGRATADFQRTDEMTPSGRKYRVICDRYGLDEEISLEAASFNVASLIT
jgi:hypothetical protein